jgi:tripartite-type tricarboxylate transporter receptor subunit TctC
VSIVADRRPALPGRRSLLAAVALALPAPAFAQAWPTRPLRIILSLGPGSTMDVIARLVLQPVAASLGQQVIVDPKPGAGGTIAGDLVAKAPPDGYTAGIFSVQSHAVAPAVYPAVPYDAVRDFTHIAVIAELPLVLGVSAASPIRSLEDFIAAARGAPAGLTVGTNGNGSSAHATIERFRRLSGAELTHVPYRGSNAPAVADVIAGRLDAIVPSMPDVAGNDRIRILAVSLPERLAGWPAGRLAGDTDLPRAGRPGHGVERLDQLRHARRLAGPDRRSAPRGGAGRACATRGRGPLGEPRLRAEPRARPRRADRLCRAGERPLGRDRARRQHPRGVGAMSDTNPEPSPDAALFRLASAWQGSRALHAATRMGLPDLLATGPRGVEDLAAVTGTHAPALRRLLRALVTFAVFAELPDGRFALGALGARLVEGPGSARGMVLWWGHEDCRRTWDALEDCVRTGETGARHVFGAEAWMARYEGDPALLADYAAGMAASAALVARAVTGAYDFTGIRHVVDVGGGRGQMIAAILAAHAHLAGTLLDRAEVVAGAPALLEEAGVAARCCLVAGDMFAAIPEGGDALILSRVVHDWGDAEAVALLARCRAATAESGRLLLVERLPEERATPSSAAQGHALSDLNMLVRTGGRERTVAEYGALLEAAGFSIQRVVSTGMPWSIVEAVA